MLDEFLMLVGPVGLKKERVDLNVLVEQLVEFFGPEAQRYDVEIRTQYHSEPLPCDLDAQVSNRPFLTF